MGFLLVDRILQLLPGEYVRGIKHIAENDIWLCPDDQGQAIFPPSFVGETLGQLAAWNVMFTRDFLCRPVAGVVSSARVHRPVRAGETLLLESFIESLDDNAVQYRSQAKVGDETVFTVDGALGPLLPMSEFISDEEIRKQFAAINIPGDWPTLTTGIEQAPNNCSSRSMYFDKLLACEPGVSLIAEKKIDGTAPWFPDHFPLNPVLPLTVLLECKRNLVGAFLERTDYQVCELRKIKMSAFVHPGELLLCYLTIKKQDDREMVLSFRSEVNNRRVCVLEMVVTLGKQELS